MRENPNMLPYPIPPKGHERLGQSSVGRLEFQIHHFIGHVFSKHWSILDTPAGFQAEMAQKTELGRQRERVRELLAGLVNIDTAPDESEREIPRLVALAELYLEQNVDPVAQAIVGGTAEPTDGRYATAETLYLMQQLSGYDPDDPESAQSLRGIAHEYLKRRRQPSTMFNKRELRAA